MATVETYSLEIIAGDDAVHTWATPLLIDTALKEAEENITDLLPQGWAARIRRWDDPDGTQERTDDD